ncbi:MAG: condensation domain-containing protein, partial [Streptosporangiaceae bacterium]
LGTDRLDPARDLTSTIESASFTLEPAVTEALLTRVPARFGVEINDVLLAGLATAVAEHRSTGGGSAVLLNVAGHGREDIIDGADVSRTVGSFTSTFPARVGPVPPCQDGDREAWARRALHAVHTQLRELPGRGIGYGLLRYLSEETRDPLAALGTPQISFSYLGRFPAGGDADWGLAPESWALHRHTPEDLPAAWVLDIQAMACEGEGGQRFCAELSWPGRLLGRAEVAAIGEAWLRTLREFARCGGGAPAVGPGPEADPRLAGFPLLSLTEADLGLVIAEIDGAQGSSVFKGTAA